jgi:2'-5' RNA ligase
VPRRRLGVALLLPEPVASEVHGLRRACADPALEAVPPHLTLVPPVNVADDDLPAALALLRREAGATRPMTLALGPAETFLPVEPVLFLGVSGEDEAVAALHDLHDRVFAPPLARPLSHPFVPHLTLCRSGTPGWIEQAARTLVAFEAEVTIDRVHLLQEVQHEERGRTWEPIADLPFAPPVVVARGGLEVELTVTEIVDPEVLPALPSELARPAEGPVGPGGRRPLVVTARRDGAVLGAAVGWTSGTVAVVRRIAIGGDLAPGEEVARHLRAAFDSAAADRGALEVHEEPVG